MKKLFFILGLISIGSYSFGQVGINNITPKGTLDISASATDGSKPEGFLVPRLTGDQIKAGDTQYGLAQRGMLIYATSGVTSTSPKTVNIDSKGFYFYDGTIWRKANASMEPWKLSGNSGTSAGTNFIGTTDSRDLVVKTNNIEAARVTSGQKLLVGTTTVPTGGTNAKLIIDNGTVNGAIQIKDGTQAVDRVFTSNADGVGSWTSSPSAKTTALGVFPTSNVEVLGNKSGAYRYSNVYIDLPKGRWMVNGGLAIATRGKFWLHAKLSSSNSGISYSGFIHLGPSGNNTSYASFFYNDLGNGLINGLMMGTSIIEVTDPTLRIYLMIEDPDNTTLPNVPNGGEGWLWQYNTGNYENFFYALPIK
jgi:hypothetical protein